MPLWKVLAGVIDGRSTNGLKRAVARLLGEPSTVADGQLLNNYAKLVSMAQCLSPKEIMNAEEAEITKVLGLLKEENVTIPDRVRYSLVMRRAQGLLNARHWEALFHCISPFGEKSEWDSLSPCLLALESQSQNVKTWQKLLFQDILTKLILQGQGGSTASEAAV